MKSLLWPCLAMLMVAWWIYFLEGRQRRAFANHMSVVNELIRYMPDFTGMLENASRKLGETLGSESTEVYVTNPRTPQFRRLDTLPKALLDELQLHSSGKPFVVRADGRAELRDSRRKSTPGARLIIPLLGEQRMLGCIVFGSSIPNFFRPAHQQLATSLMGQITLALASASVHERLTEALDAVEAANESKRQFLGFASHELRTPLQVISSQASSIKHGLKGPITDEIARTMDSMLQTAQNMARMVEELLDLNRIESGKTILTIEEFQIEDCLREVIADALPLCTAKAIVITTDFAPCLPAIQSDYALLRKTLLNLVANAVKYTEAGTICLGVKMEDRFCTLTVTDTGAGILPQDLPHIFDEFRQGTSLSQKPGSGLGLTIAKKLVSLLGGDIRVDSQVGVGSCFTILLPTHSKPETEGGVS